jgi:hypothetical protein
LEEGRCLYDFLIEFRSSDHEIDDPYQLGCWWPDSSLWAVAEWWVGPVCHASKIKVHDKHFVCRAL